MTKKHLLIIFLIIISSITLFGIKLEKSENKVIEKESFEDDYLFTGDELEFSGSADDLYFFGKKLNFTGETNSSLTAFGNEIKINGKVKNNMVTGGVSVNVSGEINDTAFISGKNIEIQKTSIINGTLFIAGKNINLSGTVNGDVMIACAGLTIDGVINGNIHAYTGKINISNNGLINGNLKYHSEKELSDQEKTKITKSVEFDKNQHNWNSTYNKIGKRNPKNFFRIGFLIIKLFILIGFIIGGFLLLLLPMMNKIEEERNSKRFWFSSLWGLIPILIYPAAIIILFMFGITIPLAIILILAVLPFLFITKVLGVTMLGQYLFKKFKWNNTKKYLYFLFGLIFYAVLSFIPFVAFISMIFFSSLGWGYIIEGLFNKKFS